MPPQPAAILVEASLGFVRQRRDETLVNHQVRVEQGRQHPPLERRVVSRIGGAGRKDRGARRQPPVDWRVHLVEGAQRGARLGPPALDDGVHHVERGLHAAQRLGPEPAVRGHAGRDQRVRQLEQQHLPGAQQANRFARGAPQHAAGRQQAIWVIPAVHSRSL